MTKRAIVVVDLQNEYLSTGKLPLAGIERALDNAARVIAAARDRGERVIHVRHEANKPDSPIFVPGSDGVRIHERVAPRADEPVIVKNFPNSFRDTGLKALLDEHGATGVTIIGAMSHMCIEATARAAADFGYEVTVVHDACATRELAFGGKTVPAEQVHTAAMAALAFGYAALPATDDYLVS